MAEALTRLDRFVAHLRSCRFTLFPPFGVFAWWDDGLRTSLGNRLMAGFGVIDPIGADAEQVFLLCNLFEQTRQHRRIAYAVIGHFYGPYL